MVVVSLCSRAAIGHASIITWRCCLCLMLVLLDLGCGLVYIYSKTCSNRATFESGAVSKLAYEPALEFSSSTRVRNNFENRKLRGTLPKCKYHWACFLVCAVTHEKAHPWLSILRPCLQPTFSASRFEHPPRNETTSRLFCVA